MYDSNETTHLHNYADKNASILYENNLKWKRGSDVCFRRTEECALDVDDIEEFQPKIFSKRHIDVILSAISAPNLKRTYIINAKDNWLSSNLYSFIKS